MRALELVVIQLLVEPAPVTLMSYEPLRRPAVVGLRIDDLADIEILAFNLRFNPFVFISVTHHVECDVEKERMHLRRELWMHSFQVGRVPCSHFQPVLAKELPKILLQIIPAALIGRRRGLRRDRFRRR